jgi:hypothetical protein
VLRCASCGEVIGIYEPLVVLENRTARHTACAAQPQLLAHETGTFYHGSCYTASDQLQEPDADLR